MDSEVANSIYVSNSFVATNKDNGNRINIHYRYNITQLMNTIHRGFNRCMCRMFIDKLMDPKFTFDNVQIRNVCDNGYKCAYVRDNDVLKLALSFLDDPRHVLIFEDINEEAKFIDSLKQRFAKNANGYKLVLEYRLFDERKYDHAFKYAKDHKWSQEQLEKLMKYVDCQSDVLGRIIECKVTDINNGKHIMKTYESIEIPGKKYVLNYDIKNNEDINKYVSLNAKGEYVSENLSDYQTIEDYLLRYVELLPNDEIFDFDNFMDEAIKIKNKYPALKDPNEVYDMSWKESKEYLDRVFFDLYDNDDDNHEKTKYVRILRVLKSLMTDDYITATKYVDFHRNFFSAAAQEHKIGYDEFERICDDLDEIFW